MSEADSRTFTKTDWLLLGVLLACILPLRVWLICNTEVTARDSIGYIRYALQFERMDWREVCEKNHQHPGYPVAIWAMSHATGAVHAPTPDGMRVSAQLVSLFASLILGGLMYLLGRQFFDRSVSFGAALLYQYLPISAQHLSDGISEPLYLVLLVSGLLHLVLALRERSIVHSLLCGLFSGLAYLTRPEGLLIAPAFAVMLVAMQIRPTWRGPWARTLWCGLAMLAVAGLCVALYVYATGRITNKLSAIETGRKVWGWIESVFSPEQPQAVLATTQLFAASFPPVDSRLIRFWHSVFALSMEIVQGFHYAAAALAIGGFWWTFVRSSRDVGLWALTTFSAIHSVILVALAMSVCYVSDRHVMILVIGGSYFVVVALRELPRWVLGWWGNSNKGVPADKNVYHHDPSETSGATSWYRSPAVWSVVLFLILIATCLPKATQRLHGNRVANREVGLWLAENLRSERGDHIEDDHGWSWYYSGFVFKEGEIPVLPRDVQPMTYVVVTRSRDPQLDAKRQMELVLPTAKVVHHGPASVPLDRARVVVYVQPRDKDKNPWTVK